MSATPAHVRVVRAGPARTRAGLPFPPHYGPEVERFAAAGGAVHVFAAPDAWPAEVRRANPDIQYGPDRSVWEQAAERVRDHGAGSCLVLPPGRAVEEYSWPQLPRDAVFGVNVVVWMHRCPRSECEAVGRALVLAGYDRVQVLAGHGCPMAFEAA